MTRLFKIEGAGNDFLLGTGEWATRLADNPDEVRSLCRRQQGIGADGTLSVFAESKDQLRLVYRNSDGSLASFCANGTRCAARAGVDILGLNRRLLVHTDWADIPAEVDGSSIRLELPAPSAPVRTLDLALDQQSWASHWIVIGVPHLVLQVDTLNDIDFAAIAPRLRHHPELGDEGANVNLVARTGGESLSIRSWERGVEGETLCCGSGVVAAALNAMTSTTSRRLHVNPRSGDTLVVEALGPPPVCASALTGPARWIAEIDPSQPAPSISG